MVALWVLTEGTLPPSVRLPPEISGRDSESLPGRSTLRLQGEVLGDLLGTLPFLASRRHGLLAHHERRHPHLLGPRRDPGRLAVHAEPLALAFQAVRDGLQPPARPLRKRFVLHLGCLLLSGISIRVSLLGRALREQLLGLPDDIVLHLAQEVRQLVVL